MYTVDYFIQKFEAIPADRWRTHMLQDECGRKCANGLCGVTAEMTATSESLALKDIFSVLKLTRTSGCKMDADFADYSVKVEYINDGIVNEYQQPTPKQRILAALYDIKTMQSKDTSQPQPKERIVYVSVPVSITEQAKELITN
jgi:hypothetical protein